MDGGVDTGVVVAAEVVVAADVVVRVADVAVTVGVNVGVCVTVDVLLGVTVGVAVGTTGGVELVVGVVVAVVVGDCDVGVGVARGFFFVCDAEGRVDDDCVVDSADDAAEEVLGVVVAVGGTCAVRSALTAAISAWIRCPCANDTD